MHCKICGKKSGEIRICKDCSYFLKNGVPEEAIRRMLSDDRAKKIWKENEKRAEDLAQAYYDYALDIFDKEVIKKDSKMNFGLNTFCVGIKVGLDIIMPLLDDEMLEIVKEKIRGMVKVREINERNKKRVKTSYKNI